MDLQFIVLASILFFVLTPGTLLRLPKKGSLLLSAGVHAVVFGIALWGLQVFVLKASEGFREGIPKEQQVRTAINHAAARIMYKNGMNRDKLIKARKTLDNFNVADPNVIENGKKTLIGDTGVPIVNSNGIAFTPDSVLAKLYN